MHTTPTSTHPRPVVRRRRLALLVAPALALVMTAACGNDDADGTGTAVLGAHVERPAEGTVPADLPPDPRLVPRRSVAGAFDRVAPIPAEESPDPRLVPRRTIPGRVAPTPADDVADVVGSRYAGQAEAYAARDVEPSRPIRVNGGRTEE
jgi:hypothetical protein